MSIIVSMVYVVYAYFSRNVSDYTQMSSEDFNLQMFNTLLKEDFYLSDKVISKNGMDLEVIYYNNNSVFYTHKNEYYIRKFGSVKDSIKVKDIKLEYLLKNGVIKSKNPVTSITVTSILYNNEARLYIYKNYFSNYFNLEE